MGVVGTALNTGLEGVEPFTHLERLRVASIRAQLINDTTRV